MMGPHRILGVALEDGSALVADVRGPRRHPTLARAAEFRFPEGSSIARPVALGEALRQWLGKEGFSARHAIVGLPASWLLCREEIIPPADREAVADVLRVKAEQDFSLDPDELSVDCCCGAPSGKADGALLVATLRERVTQVTEMVRAAGMRLQAVTATSLVLASSAPAPCCLYLRDGYGEVTVRAGGRFRLLSHFSWPGSDGAQAIADEVRRAAAQSSWSGAEGTGDITIWNAGPLHASSLVAALAEMPGNVEVAEGLSALGVGKAPSGNEGDGAAFAAAAALGLAGVRGQRPPVDFLHSALAVRRRGRQGRRIFWAAALTVVLLAAGASSVADWRAQSRTLADLRARLDGMGPELEQIRDMNENVSFGRAWCDTQPRFLNCLRELTLTFPEQGTVWATSIATRSGRGGVLSGKATDQKAVLAVMDKMNGGGGFADVKLLYVREAGAGARELSFAISFAFPGLE